ncbi:squalene/phytoene synthase family protein [Streptomyces sp. AcH 505]|uniref:squalene/phytoene synthase family protein n=1 Tax=Streptomyces sp. AcH 505 TaxID=352211 RepID=UPI000694ECA3
MRSWGRCLDLAGVRGGALRSDYTLAERYLRRREFALRGVVRVLAPPEFQPHAVVGAALLCFTDDICDRGPAEERTARFETWAGHVGAALDTGTSHHPLLRAYLHSAGERGLSRHWADTYLAGTRIDLDFPGFADEGAYQRYIDTLTWPGIMLSTGLTPHLVPDKQFAESCRLVADGAQRADLLTDLSDDLRDGRLALPRSDLARYGVTREDLEQGRDTPGVRNLIAATAATAREALLEADRIVGEVPPEYRALVLSLLGLYHHRLDNVSALGAAVTRRPVRDNPVECVRVLNRARHDSRNESLWENAQDR